MPKDKCEFEAFMSAQEDDRARLEQEQPESLTARIDAYLSDKLTGAEMKKLWDEYGPQIDEEINRRNRVAEEKRARDERKARSLWIDDIFSKADADAGDNEIRQFLLAHPNFPRRNPEKVKVLLGYLAENSLLCTVENLEKGYAFLRPQGVFSQQSEEEQAEARMSASEFKKLHASDWPEERGIPPLILEGIARSLDTFLASRPEYVRSEANKDKMMAAFTKTGMQQITPQAIEAVYQDLIASGELELNGAVQCGEVVRYTDMGGHAPGYPRQPIKPSFRRLVRELTADKLKQRMLDDKNFEAALDNLK